tara:strand:+ start:67 stop:612 length:546 start_codon:yes stop_codon:yes gene_type:complete
MRFLLIFFIVSFLFACGPKISSEQQEHLDELVITQDSLNTWFARIDNPSFDSMMQVFNLRKDYIKNEMKDTLSKEAVVKLNAFLLQSNDYDFLEENFPIMKAELETASEQLQLMQKDIDAGVIGAEKFEEYIEIEYENSKVLQRELNRFISTYRSQIELYHTMVEEVDSIIQDYKFRKGES